MVLFKCKMCGGNLEVLENKSIVQCDSCGTNQTLPRLNDDKKVQLYERANHLRRNNEYDKAEQIYDEILNEDPTDAETYWSLVLCQYGIEYVEDPKTRLRTPTVNRAQYISVLADANYKAALEYSDSSQRKIYEQEAAVIDDIQKGILKISKDEAPFDVFISYKESDDYGRRTQDSVDANDVYHQLTKEGFKVFFSRITLESKLGTDYESYIFSALHSAQVMIVIGTKEEYMNAVWVRNEWSRYLSLIKAGEEKTLIPVYRGMNPYDLPEEFSNLQALNMENLGVMQDLIRGIKKIIKKDSAPKENLAQFNDTVIPLLKRAYIFLEDKEFSRADEICEQILNLNPEEPEAYLIKLMADFGFNKLEDFSLIKDRDILTNVLDSNNFKRFHKYENTEIRMEVRAHLQNSIDSINENLRSDNYHRALKLIGAEDVEDIMKGIKIFEELGDYKDSELQIGEGKIRIYDKAILASNSEYLSDLRKSLTSFDMIPDFRDVHIKIEETNDKIKRIKQEIAEKERIENERLENIYNNAMAKYNSDDVHVIIEGKKEFLSLEGFKDSNDMIDKSNEKVYQSAKKLAKSKRTSKLQVAIEQFNLIDGYRGQLEIKDCLRTIEKNKKRKQKSILILILIVNTLIYLVLSGSASRLGPMHIILSIITSLIILHQGFIVKSEEWESKVKLFMMIALLFLVPQYTGLIISIITMVKVAKW